MWANSQQMNSIVRTIKRNSFLGILGTCVLLATTALMCDDNNESTSEDSHVKASLAQGSWRITYFFDKAEETSNFSGYNLTFDDNGTTVATKNTTTVNGSWSTENSSNGTLKLFMDFGATSPLDELNEYWRILEHTDVRIKLEHVSGGNGDTDTLILERN